MKKEQWIQFRTCAEIYRIHAKHTLLHLLHILTSISIRNIKTNDLKSGVIKSQPDRQFSQGIFIWNKLHPALEHI